MGPHRPEALGFSPFKAKTRVRIPLGTPPIASEGTNDFGEPVTSTTDYPVWAMLVQDRLARNVEAGGAYALADRVWRVRFNQAFLDAHAAQGSLSVISAAGEDPDVQAH